MGPLPIFRLLNLKRRIYKDAGGWTIKPLMDKSKEYRQLDRCSLMGRVYGNRGNGLELCFQLDTIAARLAQGSWVRITNLDVLILSITVIFHRFEPGH